MTFGYSGRTIEPADGMFTFAEERHGESTFVSTIMVPRSALAGKLDEAISAAAAAGRPFRPESEPNVVDQATITELAKLMSHTKPIRDELHPTVRVA